MKKQNSIITEITVEWTKDTIQNVGREVLMTTIKQQIICDLNYMWFSEPK